MKAKIKRRWPITEIIICFLSEKKLSVHSKNSIENDDNYNYDQLNRDLSREDISEILKNQLNVQSYKVKQINASNTVEKILEMLNANLPILPSINIIRKSIAPQVRSDIGKVVTEFEKLDKKEILNTLKDFQKFQLIYDKTLSSSVDIYEKDLEISFSIKDDYIHTEKENLIVFMPTSRNQSLIIQGLVRDLARNLQQLRKEKSYNPTEILSTAYITNLEKDEISSLSKHISDLTYLVRVKSVVLSEETKEDIEYKNIEIDGRKIGMYID
jgi:isoleucyl-tRNA synthetase